MPLGAVAGLSVFVRIPLWVCMPITETACLQFFMFLLYHLRDESFPYHCYY